MAAGPRDELECYLWLWSLHRLYETLGGGNQTLGWSMSEQACISALCAATAMSGRVRLLCATMVVVLATDFVKSPFIWDSELWAVQTDVAFLWAFVEVCGWSEPGAEERGKLYASARTTIAAQMVVFYAAAAFWKLNTAFLNPHASCAPIFAVQLLDVVWPASLDAPSAVVGGLVASAPALTLLVEGTIPLCLCTRERVGVILAACLHLAIALCPPPNNVATFSLLCASRLIAFVPSGTQRALEPSRWWPIGLSATGVALAVSFSVASHDDFFDAAVPIFVAVFPVLCLAARLDDSRKIAGARRSLVAVAAIYAFGLIPLGVHDQGQPHMYANLRLHGGSNHYVVPTGLLPRFFQHTTADIGGGIVRVERCDSTAFNDVHPSEYSADLTERARRWLAVGGHTGRMWNPMLSAVTASRAPIASPTKYTIPAHEFRRLLAVARAADEAFTIEYTQLFGVGNESWRAQAPGRTVRIVEAPGKDRRCLVLRPARADCAPDDLPNLPPLGFWARKFLLFEAYPIVPGDPTLHCFGP